MNSSQPPEKKSHSHKKRTLSLSVPSENAATPHSEPTNKKSKVDQVEADGGNGDESVSLQKKKKKKHRQSSDGDALKDLAASGIIHHPDDDDLHFNLDALSPIAHPLAGKKLCKKVLKAVKKGSRHRFTKRGVKEVVKALRKGEKGLVVLAGDISPMDVLTHIPLLAEENGSGYIFVPTKESLGAASCTKRPTSCVMITKSATGSVAAQKKYAAKKEALKTSDPVKAAKLQTDEDEYSAAYQSILNEVLLLNQKVS